MTVKYKVQVGQQFDDLTILELSTKRKLYRNGSSKYMHKCKCKCGKICYVTTVGLVTKCNKSCGCKSGTVYLGKNVQLINGLYGRYKKDASKRKLSWEIDLYNFKLLIAGNCFYCGAEPNNKRQVTYSRREKDVLTYNGIDRINNKLGYTFTNSISCCMKCNLFKYKYSLTTFLKQIEKIYSYLDLGNPTFICKD